MCSVNRIYQEKCFSLKNNKENEAGRLVSDLFLIFKNALYEVKTSVQATLSFNIFRLSSTCHTIKTNRIKLWDYWFRYMFKFDILEKGLGIVSPPYFVYVFSRIMFLMLYSISWPNFIAWLLLLLEILGNVCRVIVCYSGWNVINFKINLFFLIKPLFYMTKNSRHKFKYLENENRF